MWVSVCVYLCPCVYESLYVCVTLGIIGILSDCFSFTVVFLVQQGAGVCFRCLQPTKTHLSHSDIVLGRQNYVPAFSTEWHEAKPRTSLAADLSDRRNFALFVVFDLTLLASFPFKTSRIRWSLLVLLGNGTLGRRVAPLSVQYTYILSVFGLVPTRDEPAECLPWTR